MVDYFALALTHGLLALAAWRLLLRPDLDRDPEEEVNKTPGKSRPTLPGRVQRKPPPRA